MKRLLLDTQVLLWWLADDPRLPAWAIAAVQAPGAEVFVSQVSLWELALKQRQGRVQLDLARLEQEVTRQHFHWLPLRNEHLLALAQLDSSAAPSDLFDQQSAFQTPKDFSAACRYSPQDAHSSGLMPEGKTSAVFVAFIPCGTVYSISCVFFMVKSCRPRFADKCLSCCAVFDPRLVSLCIGQIVKL